MISSHQSRLFLPNWVIIILPVIYEDEYASVAQTKRSLPVYLWKIGAEILSCLQGHGRSVRISYG